MSGAQFRMDKAIRVAELYGPIEGERHKAWVIDQMMRALLGAEYRAWLANYADDGSDRKWDTGIAP